MEFQNREAKNILPRSEQPDLLDIGGCSQKNGGKFWVALSDGQMIGIDGLPAFARNAGGRRSILNTPSVALVEPGEQGFTPLPEDGGQLAVLFIPAQPGALRYLLRSHACIRQAVRVENAFQESRLSFRRLGR